MGWRLAGDDVASRWPACKAIKLGMILFASALPVSGFAAAATPQYDVGVPATGEDVAGWDISIPPSGEGLPEGGGTASQGEGVYRSQCASCHGTVGQGGALGPRLVGGQGTLASDHPIMTVGSYWPYATTLFDYVRRAMPFNAPGSLPADQVYEVTAYLLFLNGIVPADKAIDAATLPLVTMPNRDGFTSSDPRPDVRNVACMQACTGSDDLGPAPAQDGPRAAAPKK